MRNDKGGEMKFQIRLTNINNIMARPKSKTAANNEAKVQEALNALSRGEFPNAYQVAKHFKVSFSTLEQRLKGDKSIKESHEPVQLFAILEKALAGCITRLTASGFPITHDLLREMAEEIRKRRLCGINDDSIQHVVYEPIGQQWTQRFIQRHPNLATAMSRSIELSRLTAVTPEIVENWFNVLYQTIDEFGISWKNIYNCDESGFGVGKRKKCRL